MSLDWLRKLALTSRPEELVEIFQSLAGPAAVYLEYDRAGWCLRGPAGALPLDNSTLPGECALRGERVEANNRPQGLPPGYEGSLTAVPVRRFGSLLGVLVVSGAPRADLEELAETYALLSESVIELDRHRQALARFEQLALGALDHLGQQPGHTASVCQLTADLAEYLDVSAQERRRLWNASLYHDLGKLLSNDRQHARAGAEFLAQSGVHADLASLLQYHHECWDGSGYEGKRAGQLELSHWILALAEDFVEFREFNPHLGLEPLLQIFFQQKSHLHCPDVVDALAGLVDSGRMMAHSA